VKRGREPREESVVCAHSERAMTFACHLCAFFFVLKGSSAAAISASLPALLCSPSPFALGYAG
jgi:hypothetical protein